MKNLFAIIALMIAFGGCSKNNDISDPDLRNAETNCLQKHFYYYNGSKYFIDTILLNNKIFIGFDSTTGNTDIINFINNNTTFVDIDATKIKRIYEHKCVIAKLTTAKSCTQLEQIISQVELNPNVVFASFCYKSSFWGGGHYYDVMTYTDEFIVQVPDTNNLTALNNLVSQTATTIKGPVEFIRDWFIIKATKNSQGDPLQMSNYFYETGNFTACEPNFYNFIDH